MVLLERTGVGAELANMRRGLQRRSAEIACLWAAAAAMLGVMLKQEPARALGAVSPALTPAAASASHLGWVQLGPHASFTRSGCPSVAIHRCVASRHSSGRRAGRLAALHSRRQSGIVPHAGGRQPLVCRCIKLKH